MHRDTAAPHRPRAAMEAPIDAANAQASTASKQEGYSLSWMK